jgi:hypothetical protein
MLRTCNASALAHTDKVESARPANTFFHFSMLSPRNNKNPKRWKDKKLGQSIYPQPLI